MKNIFLQHSLWEEELCNKVKENLVCVKTAKEGSDLQPKSHCSTQRPTLAVFTHYRISSRSILHWNKHQFLKAILFISILYDGLPVLWGLYLRTEMALSKSVKSCHHHLTILKCTSLLTSSVQVDALHLRKSKVSGETLSAVWKPSAWKHTRAWHAKHITQHYLEDRLESYTDY